MLPCDYWIPQWKSLLASLLFLLLILQMRKLSTRTQTHKVSSEARLPPSNLTSESTLLTMVLCHFSRGWYFSWDGWDQQSLILNSFRSRTETKIHRIAVIYEVTQGSPGRRMEKQKREWATASKGYVIKPVTNMGRWSLILQEELWDPV